MSITVYNPTFQLDPERGCTASRKNPLEHSILGIIDNSKPNSGTVLKRVSERLNSRFKLKRVLWSSKPTASLPIPDEEAERLSKVCDFILAGIGD